MTIWHKRKRNYLDAAYGAILTAMLMTAAYIGLGKAEAYAIQEQETRCSRAAIIEFMDGIIEPQDYNPAYVPPPRRPEL